MSHKIALEINFYEANLIQSIKFKIIFNINSKSRPSFQPHFKLYSINKLNQGYSTQQKASIVNMKPQNSSPHNTVLKSFFDSDVISNQKKQENSQNQIVKKQKSTSFYGTPSYLKTPKENSFTTNLETDGKAFLTTKLQFKSPRIIKNEVSKGRQQNSKQKLKIQALPNRQYSEVNIKKLHLQRTNIESQFHTKREYIQNRVKRIESLRSTLNTSNLHLVVDKNSLPKDSQQYPKKILRFDEISRPKCFTIHCDSVKQIQKSNEKNPLMASSKQKQKNQRILEKDTIFTENKIPSFKIKLQQKSHQTSPFHEKDPQLTMAEKFHQQIPDVTETKKEKKVPSFLNGKFSTKNQLKDNFKPKQFPKFFASNLNSQKLKQEQKIPEKRILSNNKHAKSFSVFQTPDFSKKNLSFHVDYNSTAESFHPTQRQKSNQSGYIKNSAALQKDSTINVLKPQQKSLRICPNFEKVKKVVSSSLRSTLVISSSRKQIQSESVERVNFDKKNKITEFLPSDFLPPSNPKKIRENFQRSPVNSKIVAENDLIKSKKENESKQIQNAKIQKISIIDDIKQTLIGCNLLSEQQYENVLENHKKDILKPKNYQNNDQKPEKLNSSFSPQKRRTSIKDIIDSEEQDNKSEEGKKFYELTEMCEQKRSKWMLEPTDIIRESLKQLSEFNTEKTLYDSEWKKISTTKNNRSNHKKFTYFDEVREEETNSDSKEQSKISSIRVLSEKYIDEIDYESERRARFHKSKQNSQKITTLQCLQQIERNSEISFGKLSLDDFQILWSTEEPIFLKKQTQNGKTFISYGARHKATNFIVTIKKFEKSTLREQGKEFLDKFITSLKLQSYTLNHPNIEKIYTIFNDRYNIYIVCEFTQTRLSYILVEGNKDKGVHSSQTWTQYSRLVQDECNKGVLLGEIIDGLEEIHLNHAIHKNIHPNAVRIVSATVKISGFTQAEIISTPVSQICNEYMCPESLFDSAILAMDIWCLGILTYELQIRRKPFNQESKIPTQKVKKILQCSFDIPLEKASLCEEFLNSALIRNPKDRASIFDLKNIWTRKLKENNLAFKSSKTLLNELQILFEP